MAGFKSVDFFAQNELFWTWEGLKANPNVALLQRLAGEQLGKAPLVAEIDVATAYAVLLTLSSVVFTCMGAKKVLQKHPIEVRFFGSWLGVIASTLAVDLLSGQPSSSIFSSPRPFVFFLVGFFLVNFPGLSAVLHSAPVRLFVFLLHGVSKSAGLLDTAAKAALLFPQNPVFAAFFLMFAKAVATLLAFDLFSALAGTPAPSAAASGKLLFWVLPSFLCALASYLPGLNIGLADSTLGLIITDIVVYYYLISWYAGQAPVSRSAAQASPAAQVSASAKPAVMVVQQTPSQKKKQQ
ncbi:MAG: hypothetical protein Q8P67_23195 [archaeon]|nr:hypothetical protein [archaeon]